MEIMEVRRQWNKLFEVPKENNCKSRLMYQDKTSYNSKHKINSFPYIQNQTATFH